VREARLRQVAGVIARPRVTSAGKVAIPPTVRSWPAAHRTASRGRDRLRPGQGDLREAARRVLAQHRSLVKNRQFCDAGEHIAAPSRAWRGEAAAGRCVAEKWRRSSRRDPYRDRPRQHVLQGRGLSPDYYLRIPTALQNSNRNRTLLLELRPASRSAKGTTALGQWWGRSAPAFRDQRSKRFGQEQPRAS